MEFFWLVRRLRLGGFRFWLGLRSCCPVRISVGLRYDRWGQLRQEGGCWWESRICWWAWAIFWWERLRKIIFWVRLSTFSILFLYFIINYTWINYREYRICRKMYENIEIILIKNIPILKNNYNIYQFKFHNNNEGSTFWYKWILKLF